METHPFFFYFVQSARGVFVIADENSSARQRLSYDTRRQTVLRIIELDHLCDKVLFRSKAERTVCHCQCHAA